MFEKMVISRSSIWYKLALFGGFNENPIFKRDNDECMGVAVPKSSCDVISSMIIGVMKLYILTLVSVGTLFDTVLGLVWLGAPHAVESFVRSLPFVLALFYVGGILVYVVLVIACIVALVIYLVDYVWPWVKTVFKVIVMAVPDVKVRDNINDYLDGICKPVKIVD